MDVNTEELKARVDDQKIFVDETRESGTLSCSERAAQRTLGNETREGGASSRSESNKGTHGMVCGVILFKPRTHLFACTLLSVPNSCDCNALLVYKHRSIVLCVKHV